MPSEFVIRVTATAPDSPAGAGLDTNRMPYSPVRVTTVGVQAFSPRRGRHIVASGVSPWNKASPPWSSPRRAATSPPPCRATRGTFATIRNPRTPHAHTYVVLQHRALACCQPRTSTDSCGSAARASICSTCARINEPALSIGSKGKAGTNIFDGQFGEITEYFFGCHARRQVLQHVLYRDPHPADAGFPATCARFDSNDLRVIHSSNLAPFSAARKSRSQASHHH